MALEDGAVVKAGVAHVLLAPENTAAPTLADITALASDNPVIDGWDNFGHTSLDNDFAPFMDGGESTVEGSRQNPKLRESVATATEGMDISSIQVSRETLSYYYGGTGSSSGDGVFGIPQTANTINRAVLVVYFDGSNVVAEYHSKASVRRSGPITNGAEGFMQFPIRLTWLQGTNEDAWIGEMLSDDGS